MANCCDDTPKAGSCGSTLAPSCCDAACSAPVEQVGQLSTFRIEQMDCSTEEALIRSKLEKIPEVQELQFNLLNRTLGVRHASMAHQTLVEAIASVGMRAEPLAATVSTRVAITQMDCPTEERLITDKLSGMPGIAALQFNLLQRPLTISHEPDALAPALSAIRELGFTPQSETEAKASTEAYSPVMFLAGWDERDYREMLGQAARIPAALLFSKIWVPLGNTGRARVRSQRLSTDASIR